MGFYRVSTLKDTPEGQPYVLRPMGASGVAPLRHGTPDHFGHRRGTGLPSDDLPMPTGLPYPRTVPDTPHQCLCGLLSI